MEKFLDRNKVFAETRFDPGLRMRPSSATIVIGCVDPRVDPAVVLGAEQGEVLVLRNVGGRVTQRTLLELVMLREVGRANGSGLGDGWDVVVLQHTQCGITLIRDRPDLLSPYFQVDVRRLDGKAVDDPRAAVAHDVGVLRAETRLAGIRVSGLVYDITTGLVETVVEP
ncbi:carbonic anhydrase [Umezawaea sp. NPDC059074]|uniref:carbonic anhydrase n=1 Tax=Umezawaea sp. NPDC059074 TaxID=3346716 RepID=UPI0036B5C1F3